ncbi:MAG: Cobyrinic acid a,c-diamide synthetase (EC 6.3.5.11), partial [Olavius algarvensis Gamma 1 endosymbiont]
EALSGPVHQRARLQRRQDHRHRGPGAFISRPWPRRARLQDRPRFSRPHDPRTGLGGPRLQPRPLHGWRTPLPPTPLRSRRARRPHPHRRSHGTIRRQPQQRRPGHPVPHPGAGGHRRFRHGPDLRRLGPRARHLSPWGPVRRGTRQPGRRGASLPTTHGKPAPRDGRIRMAGPGRGDRTARPPPWPGAGRRNRRPRGADPGRRRGAPRVRRNRLEARRSPRTGADPLAGRARGSAHRHCAGSGLRLPLSRQPPPPARPGCATPLLLPPCRQRITGSGRPLYSGWISRVTLRPAGGQPAPQGRHPRPPYRRQTHTRRVRGHALPARIPHRRPGPHGRHGRPAAGTCRDAGAARQPRDAQPRAPPGRTARPHLPLLAPGATHDPHRLEPRPGRRPARRTPLPGTRPARLLPPPLLPLQPRGRHTPVQSGKRDPIM